MDYHYPYKKINLWLIFFLVIFTLTISEGIFFWHYKDSVMKRAQKIFNFKKKVITTEIKNHLLENPDMLNQDNLLNLIKKRVDNTNSMVAQISLTLDHNQKNINYHRTIMPEEALSYKTKIQLPHARSASLVIKGDITDFYKDIKFTIRKNILSILLVSAILFMLLRETLKRYKGQMKAEIELQKQQIILAQVRQLELTRFTMFNIVKDPLILTSVEDGSIIDANKAIENYFDMDINELKGKNLVDLGVWKTKEERSEFVKLLLQKREIDSIEYQTEIRGKLLTGIVSARLVNLEGENRIFVHIRDITEEKKRIEALKKNEARLKEAEREAKLGHWGYSFETGKMIWSEGTFNILGYDSSNIEPSIKKFLAKIHPDDRRRLHETYKNSISQKSSYELVFRTIEDNDLGHTKYLKTKGTPMYTAEKRPLKISGILQDMTQEHSLLQKLETSEKYWRDTFNAVDSAILLLDKKQKILLSNRACNNLTNDTNKPIYGQYCYDVLCGGKKSSGNTCPVQETLKTGKKASREIIHHETGKTFASSSLPVFDKNGDIDYLVCSIRDITEEKQTEAMLLHSQKLEAIGTLAGGIAHDFNNILTSISGFSELALLPGIKTEKKDYYLEKIKTASQRAANLIKNILTFSRKNDTQKSPILLAPMIKEIIQFLRASIPTTIEIESSVPESDLKIMADPAAIHQILMNLCTNAYHAMSKSGGKLKIKLHKIDSLDNLAVSSEIKKDLSKGRWAELEISDTGHGINPEILPRIFEPYFTTKKSDEGAGLGLSLVHGIVKSHQGHIKVESKKGEGSTFRVFLPLYQAGDNNYSDNIVQALPEKGSGKIMIVDDETEITRLMEEYLQESGYDTESFNSPLEAIYIFEKEFQEVNLLITDLTMPEMNGIELVKKLKIIKEELPVIMCTGYMNKEWEEEAKEAGVNLYVNKPVNMAKLTAVIKETLAA